MFDIEILEGLMNIISEYGVLTLIAAIFFLIVFRTIKQNDDLTKRMNNLDTKARERSKALSKLQKENEELKQQWKEKRHEDINELSVIAMKYKALQKKNEQLKEANQSTL